MLVQGLQNRLEREQILGAVVDDENIDVVRRRRRCARHRSIAVRRGLNPRHAFPGGATWRAAFWEPSSRIRGGLDEPSPSFAASTSIAEIWEIVATRASGTQRIAA